MRARRTVFADTFHFLAVMDPRDAWHDRVVAVSGTLAEVAIVTMDAVLIEVLNAFAARHPLVRQTAAANVVRILADPQIEVVSQTREDFVAALALYQDRPDKQYSLTDCISMNLMRARHPRGADARQALRARGLRAAVPRVATASLATYLLNRAG